MRLELPQPPNWASPASWSNDRLLALAGTSIGASTDRVLHARRCRAGLQTHADRGWYRTHSEPKPRKFRQSLQPILRVGARRRPVEDRLKVQRFIMFRSSDGPRWQKESPAGAGPLSRVCDVATGHCSVGAVVISTSGWVTSASACVGADRSRGHVCADGVLRQRVCSGWLGVRHSVSSSRLSWLDDSGLLRCRGGRHSC